jgi:uncharacterized protein
MYTKKEALELMKKYADKYGNKDVYGKVMEHTKSVQKKAVEVAEKAISNGQEIDIEFIKAAVILHDIGRFKYSPWSKESIRHGIEGAEILKEEGWPESFQRVCERHIGVGILKKDIEEQELPLPKKNYLPETKEEKIICYADNLCAHNIITNEKEVIERYRKELGEEHGKRVEKFHEEIHELIVGSKKL